MDTLKIITSIKHPLLREPIHLKKWRGRDENGKFLVEGHREILRAVERDFFPEKVFVSVPISLKKEHAELIALLADCNIPLTYCSSDVIDKLSCRDNSDGFLGIFKEKKLTIEDFFLESRQKGLPFYLIIEGVEKPGNIGAILRSADAAGVTGIFFCDMVVDLYNPNIIRSSLGTIFSVPVIEMISTKAYKLLKEKKIKIITTSPQGNISYSAMDYSEPLALVFGSEKDGVTGFWSKSSDEIIFIPMKGYADSLNVGMAVTVTLYEVLKQREK
ncbi:MAG: RNA methyltransferase [Victivallaceae bacterium]